MKRYGIFSMNAETKAEMRTETKTQMRAEKKPKSKPELISGLKPIKAICLVLTLMLLVGTLPAPMALSTTVAASASAGTPVVTIGNPATAEVALAPRVAATVLNIPGYGTPTWLLDKKGRTWVNPLPLDTYVVFRLPEPLSRALFQWMASGNYDYTTIQFGGPSSYEIQYSSNSTNGVDGNWTTAANVQNNPVSARAHVIEGLDIRWIRFRVTGGGSSIDEIDIHDLSGLQDGVDSPDTWGFIGDSITAFAFWRDAAAGKPFNTYVNEADPARYPSMINFGVGGQNAQHIRDRLQRTIDLNPGVHFWAVGIGTNGNGSTAEYENYLRDIIQILRENGKQPVIARIPYARDAAMDVRIREYNGVVDKLTQEYGLIEGPDLYTAFRDNAATFFRDSLHPNNAGIEVMNRLWAQAALSLSLASGGNGGDGGSGGGDGGDGGDGNGGDGAGSAGPFTISGTKILQQDGSE
ncbi:MAG: GDSL-type esterase/lipase family protein, partial [Oscillospiraceae bacterium]|nr:GDSL-type esterase/lipase family protein [Oscillospiraceae bacterium]